MRLLSAAMPAALLLALTGTAHAQDASGEKGRQKRLDAAIATMLKGNVDAARTALEPLIASYDRAYQGEARPVFCAKDADEAVIYRRHAGPAGARVIGKGWCQALWAEGYALADAGDNERAIEYLNRATAMAPRNAQYQGELGYALSQAGRMKEAYTAYQRQEVASRADPDNADFYLAKALFGQGYVLIELDRLDEAEAVFNRLLILDPDHDKAQDELDYIRQLRERRS